MSHVPMPRTLEGARTLTHDQRASLTSRLLTEAGAATDPDAREVLLGQAIAVNLRVARAVAARFRGRGVALEDLEQVASEGLVKAVRRFDPSLDHDLLSYAVPTMTGEIRRFFRDHGWMVRPPRNLQALQGGLNRAIDDLSGELGSGADHAGDL